MAAYTGLLLRLKDKNTCVPDKLKLAKFAWITDTVQIPNKHQQILDFVCGLLLNRKKHNIADEDAVLVWESLDKFLYLAGTGSAVKPSALQAVVDDLRVLTAKERALKNEDTDYLLHILKSTSKLLALQSVTAFQFENLCVLLSVVCQLLIKPGLQPKVDVELQALLQSLLAVLIKNQKSHLNQLQVLNFVTEKLLGDAIKILDKLQCLKLQEFLLGCLLHQDHQELYAVYLRHTFAEPGHIKQASKCVANVFTALSAHVTESEVPTLTTLLPEFMNMFVSQNRLEPRLCYLLLQQLIKMVMPPQEVADNSGSGDEWRLEIVARCLETCQDCDLFSASSETNDILKWFFQLTKIVLGKERSSAWFAYLRAALNLNHLVVEKFWNKILDFGFANSQQIPEDCYINQDLFLSDLVSTYIKLRRASDLLSVCLTSVEASASGTHVFSHLPLLFDRLGHMFSEAPLGSLLEMWDNLQATSVRLVELLSGQSPDSSRTYTCLHWVLSFYTILLGNARLFNQWGFGVLGQRLVTLTKQLEEKVLLVLHRKKDIATVCPSWDSLLSTWAVVKILSFPKWRTGTGIECGDQMEPCTEKLSQKLDPISRLRLVVQRQIVASVAHPESAETQENRQTTVESIVEDLLELPKLSTENVFKVWDGQNRDCTALELPVSQFHQFSQMFPLIGQSLSNNLIDKLVDLLVGVLSLATVKDMSSIHAKGTTLFTEVKHFLDHPATKEVKILQERLSSAVWRIILSGLGPSSLSPKKKKKKLNHDEDSSNLDTLKALITHKFKAEECISSTLDLSHMKEHLHVLPHFAVMIKVLRNLDLEYLPDVSLQCQIGTCVLMACLDRSVNNEGLTNLVEGLLIRCLSIPNLSRLFKFVKPTELLELVIKAGTQGGILVDELLRVTVGAVMNDYEAVLTMPVFVQELTANLQDNNDNTGVIKMKVLALIIKNCHRYVSKSFHVQRIRDIAPGIFFCLAKFVVKHGLEWLEKAKLPLASIASSPKFEAASKMKNRKRKMTEHDGSGPKKQQPTPLISSEDLCTAAWASLLECLTEVLQLWSKDIVDNKFNEHLATMVTTVLAQALTDLESGLVATKVKVPALQFIRACCHCHLRCTQSSTDEQNANASLSSPPPPDQSTSSDDSLCLLSGNKLEQIWTSSLSLCVSELSQQLRLSACSHKCPNSNDLPQAEDTQSICTGSASPKVKRKSPERVNRVSSGQIKSMINVSTNSTEPIGTVLSESTEERTEHECRWLNHIETWPDCLTAHVDVLAAVMESSDLVTFKSLLSRMTQSLVVSSDPDPGTVYILMAVWRRLVRSQLLANDHVQEMFSSMYKFLSVISSFVQFHENLTCPPSHLVAASSGPGLSLHGASRAVVGALSDFVDLGKALVTPRMALLCLNAAFTFTLTHPADLDALYRLLNTLLVYHTNTALRAVPSILHVANKLISSCIEQGSEERLAKHPEMLKDLLQCAQSITRLLTLLSSSTYKLDLNKVAYNILATYLIGVQRGSLHSSVKRELVKGMHKVMSMCDKFRLAALNASLPVGVKDTFKVLHQDYEKYHRYSGFV